MTRSEPYHVSLHLGRTVVVWLTVAGVSVLALSGCFAGRLAAQASACHSSDSTSVRTIRDFKDLVSSSDSFVVRVRTRLGLPKMPTSKVSYVTASQTCSAAVTALNSYFNTPGTARTVYVYKLGNSYGVEDPAATADGAYRGIVIYTSTWAFQAAYAPN